MHSSRVVANVFFALVFLYSVNGKATRRTTTDELVFRAKLAEQAEQYEEMATLMKEVVEKGGTLSVEARNLFSVANTNVVAQARSAWRVVSSIEQEYIGDPKQALVKQYKKKMAEKVYTFSRSVVGLLDQYLIRRTKNTEAKVFYLKMKGDYYRYAAEVSPFVERKPLGDRAKAAYNEASKIANDLPATHPLNEQAEKDEGNEDYRQESDPWW